MHEFEVEPLENGGYRTFIDGQIVKLSAVDVRLRVDEVPSVKVEFASKPEIDIQGELELSDEDVLEMVRKRMNDCEFRRSLYWVIEDWNSAS